MLARQEMELVSCAATEVIKRETIGIIKARKGEKEQFAIVRISTRPGKTIFASGRPTPACLNGK